MNRRELITGSLTLVSMGNIAIAAPKPLLMWLCMEKMLPITGSEWKAPGWKGGELYLSLREPVGWGKGQWRLRICHYENGVRIGGASTNLMNGAVMTHDKAQVEAERIAYAWLKMAGDFAPPPRS